MPTRGPFLKRELVEISRFFSFGSSGKCTGHSAQAAEPPEEPRFNPLGGRSHKASELRETTDGFGLDLIIRDHLAVSQGPLPCTVSHACSHTILVWT